MAVHDLYSKRQKALRGEIPDVFIFNKIPYNLRVQIVQIIKGTIGKRHIGPYVDKPAEAYSLINKSLCHEYGLFSLFPNCENDPPELSVLNFFLVTEDVEKAIDVIEFSFLYIEKVIKPHYTEYIYHTDVDMTPDNSIAELNFRFKENGIGYQYESGKIFRVDSLYIHSEIIKPVLNLLQNPKFKGANEEFLKAHEHYRHGRNKECLTECLKAFESTMKIICKEKGWSFNSTDTSNRLIQICLQNNIIPSFTQNQFTSLNSLLESGIPTIRNKLSGHGQGQVPQKVDDEMTRYGLNLTGTNIIFLIEHSGL
ncbi:MAG: hypothetical protein MUO72_05590 [Bacteroidales bacterium]|nr:hypothetical protein [Bacteroidales bacterium]